MELKIPYDLLTPSPELTESMDNYTELIPLIYKYANGGSYSLSLDNPIIIKAFSTGTITDLNRIVGPSNWSSEYKFLNNHWVCKLTIINVSKEGISNTSPEEAMNIAFKLFGLSNIPVQVTQKLKVETIDLEPVVVTNETPKKRTKKTVTESVKDPFEFIVEQDSVDSLLEQIEKEPIPDDLDIIDSISQDSDDQFDSIMSDAKDDFVNQVDSLPDDVPLTAPAFYMCPVCKENVPLERAKECLAQGIKPIHLRCSI